MLKLKESLRRCRAVWLISLALIGATGAPAQGIAAIAGTNNVTLNMRMIQMRFITSNANTASEALKDNAISAAGTQVASSVAGIAGGKLLTLPIVGAMPVAGVLAVAGVLHKKTVKGFTVDYLMGRTAETVLATGEVSFKVDTGQSKLQSGGVQVFPPVLVHLKPAGNDFARVVRTVHISYKEPGGNIMTAQVLDSEQDIIPCQSEQLVGDEMSLTPKQPLGPGEYAVVLPTRQMMPGFTANQMWTLVWDFRVK